MGSPWAPLCDIALKTTFLQFEVTSGPADVALEEMAQLVLEQIALPNVDSANVDPKHLLTGWDARARCHHLHTGRRICSHPPLCTKRSRAAKNVLETISWTTLKDI